MLTMRGHARLLSLFACVVLLAPSVASPQDELARIARPWKRAGAWLTGQAEPRRPRTRAKATRDLQSEEEAEAEREAEEEDEIEVSQQRRAIRIPSLRKMRRLCVALQSSLA